MITFLLAAATLLSIENCKEVATDPEAALAQSVGLQGFIYGYPIVDLLQQMHNETHRVRSGQPVAAPVNHVGIYPGVLTPKTQGQLRSPNADTLYVNAWIDLSQGPVLLDVPEMAKRYYTLAFMDLYAKPHHLGTRTNGGKASRYALISPSSGIIPSGYQEFRLPTDTAWMLGRILVTDAEDEVEAKRLAGAIIMTGAHGPAVTNAEPARYFEGLTYFSVLNRALKSLPANPGEEALVAGFDSAGFGPSREFDPEQLSPSQKLGLGCAVQLGPQVLAKRGFKPTQRTNGWLLSNAVASPGRDYLLRAEIARGGYVNDPEESIYPAAIADSSGQMLNGQNQYRIRFEKDQLPPVQAFWSLTAYDMKTLQLTENQLRRYAIGDRTKGLRYAKDGSLEIILSAKQPDKGIANWLPVPRDAFHIVARLYLPLQIALDGRYALPKIERIETLPKRP